MSVKTTYTISREIAQQVLINSMRSIFEMTDNELEEMLEALPENRFRNYTIRYPYDNEDGYSIKSVEDFFQ